MPARLQFFKRANSDVFAVLTVACARVYNARPQLRKGLIHVDPHELSSEFLLRVWPQNRAAALVCLDQPPVLRQVLSRVCEVTLAAANDLLVCAVTLRRVGRTWLPPCPAASDHRAAGAAAKLNNQSFRKLKHYSGPTNSDDNRRRLSLRRAHKERHPVLPPRTWTSTLLATQRRPCNAAAGKTAD